MIDKEKLKSSMELACRWLIDTAQVRTEKLTFEKNSKGYKYKNWQGAIRNEYKVSKKEWDFFGTVWHTGQAIKALVMTYRLLGKEQILQSAKYSAKFLINQQILDTSDPDYGFINAYEDFGDGVNISAINGCLEGLIHLSEIDETYKENVILALEWIAKKAYIDGEGLFYDVYFPWKREFAIRPYLTRDNAPGRPLLDDGVFIKGYHLSKNERFKKIFFETAERVLRDEDPPGNWIHYAPCNPERGNIHPRMAYWWARPMLMAYQETGDKKYLNCAKRCADWYAKAQRKDGGIFRNTYIDFNTDSFGHATSGIACAVILWHDFEKITGQKIYNKHLIQALKYCLSMQFREPQDANLKGCILEKVIPPDGTDVSPYHVRDLGTIFFIQAASLVLRDFNKIL